jgi:hypothetical protein
MNRFETVVLNKSMDRHQGFNMVPKIFDQNGNVCQDEIICLKTILTFENVTVFFFEDHTFQVMVNHQPVFSYSQRV